MRHFTLLAAAVTSVAATSVVSIFDCDIYSSFFLDNIFSVILLGVFRLFDQNVVTILVNGTIIRVYKYVYEYNRACDLSGLGGLVIQPAVQAISLCWLGRLVFSLPGTLLSVRNVL